MAQELGWEVIASLQGDEDDVPLGLEGFEP